MNNVFWVRMLVFGLVLLIALTTVLVVNINPIEIVLSYLALLAAVVIVGLATNIWTGLIVSVASMFTIILFNRYSGVYVLQTNLAYTGAELVAFFLAGPIAGCLGGTIGQIQRRANHWQAYAEAQTVHDKTFGTLKPAWAEIRLKEELLRANQFKRPLSVLLLQLKPEADGAAKVLYDRIAVLQAIIRLGRSLTQPPAVVTCFDEDQVLLILPEYTGEHADELGQALLDRLPDMLFFPDKETKPLGKRLSQWGAVDIGVASLNGQGTTEEMLLTQARAKFIEKPIKYQTNGTNGALSQVEMS